MRRSNHTIYTSLDTAIYEYKRHYFILQRCQQGQELDPAHGSEQLVSDFCALSAKMPIDSSAVEIGSATLKALDDFDVIGHPFDKFDIPARNKVISSWFGARGMGSLEKNCRVVQIIQEIATGVVSVKPFDNHNRNNWNGPMEDKVIKVNPATAVSLGEAIQAAFLAATYHPERKDPI
jgi:hypothetical protein